MTTSTAPPQIFDRPLLARRLARALKAQPATFLLERVVDDVASRLDAVLRPFPRVLDLATPTPLLAQTLATRPDRHITRAAPLPETAQPGIETLVCDAETLPFAPASFDLAVSALALHFVNDLPGTLIQIRRALAPDGLFLACIIGGQTLTELRAALAAAEEEIVGGASPRVAPFADIRDLGALLQRAGFALPVTDTDTITVRYANLFALMADLRAMGATNVLTQRLHRPTRRALFLRAAEIYTERYADADGRLRATFELIWLSGWAPHESQQKPLQPGSAKMRLADALGVKESKL
ncbi:MULTISPECIES: methyltransferase domain-containing protein [unclassified Beijerinckia]|uniref:methyltransferase domain-containing protein n=1 Tax=unclassified Beijerinckia TaxID=2638183 RepID=UPI000B860E25|nr:MULTISPECIES: methyltransferase domain-containing protein [unclassified Beijerinckia]